MLTVTNLTLTFGDRTLFQDVNLRFLPGNCYGLIGANGAGKSTFLQIVAGQLDPTSGEIATLPGQRIALLSQDQFAFDDVPVLDAVILGHRRLYEVLKERDALYAKPDFDEADGLRAGELEAQVAEMNGYDAESDAATLLSNLGLPEAYHGLMMDELEATQKLRVLLAQALFGNPDILLLDEPTNQLDLHTIRWLEEFLINYKSTVIVVSHDRHFLNNVCTHIADVDFGRIRLFVGNFDFWYQSSQLIMQQLRNQQKKRAEKIAELQAFIRRFSANVAKSRQATARKKMIDKLTIDDLPISSRRFPFVDFKPERACGRMVLTVEELSHAVDEVPVLRGLSLTVNPGDKIAFIGPNDLVKTVLFDLLAGEMAPDAGTVTWGVTITPTYLPKENSRYFETDVNLIDWLRQYSSDDSESFLRGFLGRMLFSGDEALKSASVLSGGEKVRCMLARAMLSGANVLLLDEPTNHLDLEAITALNEGLIRFPEVVLFSSHDYQFVDTIANRIVEIAPGGVIDRTMTLETYLDDPVVAELRDVYYHGHEALRL